MRKTMCVYEMAGFFEYENKSAQSSSFDFFKNNRPRLHAIMEIIHTHTHIFSEYMVV